MAADGKLPILRHLRNIECVNNMLAATQFRAHGMRYIVMMMMMMMMMMRRKHLYATGHVHIIMNNDELLPHPHITKHLHNNMPSTGPTPYLIARFGICPGLNIFSDMKTPIFGYIIRTNYIFNTYATFRIYNFTYNTCCTHTHQFSDISGRPTIFRISLSAFNRFDFFEYIQYHTVLHVVATRTSTGTVLVQGLLALRRIPYGIRYTYSVLYEYRRRVERPKPIDCAR